ncbi:LacI family DNA-binding transcriptional regulator [Pseudooceanicola aestuarii]|uniref:LacI family DNA-binding transcriptional regulator n=1 Tax=Pseudooceanicola aestuarii TaxID=2697319 RepID=UPI0013D331E4|nr:LacI family DNA-binding transcriptional regulator [Pseudooceanicola aestuarii]
MDKRMPTLSDVARHAGVSYATADRVVNNRGGVAEKSAARVRAAVDTLGYLRNVAAANLSQQRTYRFVAIIPGGTNAFFRRVRELLARERERLTADRVALRLETVEAFDPEALTDCLARLGEEKPDGIVMVGSEDSRVTAASQALRDSGVAVVTLVSDLGHAARDAYVGIDNQVAGRTAGRVIGLTHGGRAGRILPIIGALTARDHAERLEGLKAAMAELYPEIAVAPELQGRDRPDLVEPMLIDVLARDPAITAIYSVGGGNSGLFRVLEDPPQGRRRPIVVLHEAVEHTRRAARRGLVDVIIDQRPDEEIALALAHLRQFADRLPPLTPAPIVPAIYVAENLPPEDETAGAEATRGRGS